MSIHTRFSDNMVFIEGRFRDMPPRKKITSFRMAANEALEITKHALYKISLVIAKYILVLIGKPAKNFCTFSRVEGVGVYHCSYSYDEFKKFHNTAKRRIFAITTASVTIIALLFSVIFPGKPIGRAASAKTWTQIDWSGGYNNGSNITYTTQGGAIGKTYNDNPKGANIITGYGGDGGTVGQVKLSTASGSWLQTDDGVTDRGFNATTGGGVAKSQTVVSGTLDAAKVSLATSSSCYSVPLLPNNGGGCWWNRRPIAIPVGFTANQTDYQVKVTLTTSALGSPYASINASGSDIRFADSAGNPLFYWIETWNNVGTSTIWVKVNSISTTGTTMYMYYNNTLATSASSAANTFAFYDDFPGTSLDGTKWGSTGTPSVSGGILTVNGSTGNAVYGLTNFGTGYALRFSANFSSIGSGGWIEPGHDADYSGAAFISKFFPYSSTFYIYEGNNTANQSDTAALTVAGWTGSYHTWEIARTGTVTNFFADGVLKYAASATPSTTARHPNFMYHTTAAGYPIYVDWVYIRKYDATEQTPTVGTEQTTFAYYTSGTFTSQVYNTGYNNQSWGNISWGTTQTAAKTQIVLRAKSGSTSTITGIGACPVIATIDSTNANNGTGYNLIDSINGTVPNGNLAPTGCVSVGDKYIQYQATLSNTDTAYSPSLDDITLRFNYYPASQSLTSTPYNSENAGTILSKLTWTEDLTAGNVDINFQLRTAPNSAGAPDWTNGSGWCGPADCGSPATGAAASSFYTDPAGGEAMIGALKNGYKNQWIQYKVWLYSTTGQNTPILSAVNMEHDINTPPSVTITSAPLLQINDTIAVNYNLSDAEQTSANVSIFADIGVALKETLGDSTDPGSGAITVSDATLLPSYGVIQLANPNRGGAEQIMYTGKTNNGNGTWDLTGAVRAVNKTKYDSHPIDTTAVLIKAVTVSTTAGNGTVWNSANIINQSACEAVNGTWDAVNSKCSQYGIINFASGINGTPSPKSASWNIKTDLPGTYTASAKIIVTANDNQIGNPTGTNEAAGITIDTKNPVAALTGTSPVIPVKIDLNNSRLRVGISANAGETATSMRFSTSDLSGVSCADESLVPWVPYAATSSWSSGSTVYYQFKDAFCNLLSGSSSAPSTPQSPSVADVSYYPQSKWRNLVWWTAQGSSMTYKTYRTDGTTTLGQILDSSSTAAITLSSISLLPSSGTIKIDNEEIGYTAKSGSAINGTITRGANNTLASAHASGAAIMLLVGSATDPINYCFDEGDGNCTNDNAGSLSSSTTYVYKTVAEKNDGISDYSTTVSAIPSGDKGGIKDVTGPTLSTGPASSGVSYTSATIAWTTNNDPNDYSNSLVKYGTVSGSLTSVAASAVNATERTNTHQVLISGLDAGTKYYYQVLSTDAAGNNCVTCSALTYNFTTTVPAINDASIVSYPGSGTAAIYWTTTGPATTRVYYQKSSNFTTLPLTYTALQTDKTTNHTAVIPSGLDLDSTYYYEVESRYGASDTPVYSLVKSFVTPASRQGAAPLITLVSAASNPSDYTKATVSWTTNLSSYSIVEYDTQGTSPLTQSRAKITDALTSHSVVISGLTPGSAYDYIVYSADTYGNLASSYATFTATADTTKPALDGVVSNVTSRTSATIYWKTTEASNTQVKYIEALNNTTIPTISSTLKTEKLLDHYVIIDSVLSSDKTYNYQVLSTDAAGNTLAYPETAPYLQFRTSADKSDNIPPVITPATLAASINASSASPISISSTYGFPSSGIIQAGSEKISYTGASSNTLSGIIRGASGTIASAHSAGDVIAANVTSNSALFTWTTNKVSDSYVYFASAAEYIGNGNSYSFEQGTPTIGTSHKATVVGLAAGTTYHYQLKSRDAFGNAGTTSTDYTFTTDSDTTPPSAVSDLAGTNVAASSVTLTWTVPGDDGAIGTATSYDIRYTTDSAVAATPYAFNADWNTSAKVTEAINEPKPITAGPGITQSMVVTGLSPNTAYYFAMKTSDEVPNTSAISNILAVKTNPQSDTAVPVITNIAKGTPAANSITITWNTANKNSSSLIDYGTDGNFTYGSTQGDSSVSTKTHSVALAGLAPSTTYYYRVKSVDSLGNMGQIPLDTDSVLTKASYSFTTASAETGTLPVISSITKTKLSATSYKISWTTDIASDSLAAYGIEGSVPVYPLELGSAAQATSHSITLTNLSPSKTYNFLVKSRNGTKQAVSANDTFVTTDGLDTIPPIFTVAPQVSSVTGTTAVITWSTSEKSNSFVDFGTAANSYTSTQGNSSDSVLSHSVTLASLTASTAYYFQIRSVDAANNSATANNSGSGYTFTTTAGAVVSCPSSGGGGSSAPACPVSDTTPPVITDISVSDITFNSATVGWKTDEDANSNGSYGKEKQGYNGSTSDFKTFSKTHKIVLTNLDSSTAYYFKVSSSDAKGNLAESTEQTFKTLAISDISDKDRKAVEEMKKEFEEIAKALVKENITSEEDIREIMSRVKNPPVISGDGPNIKNIKSYGATVTWTTDRKANSIVKYSPFSASSGVLAADSSWKQFGVMDSFDTDHEIDLMGLSPSTQYSFLVESQDVLGNISKSNIKTFITSAASSIFGVNAADITLNSVVINWETANQGTSILEYGPSSVYGNSKNKGEEKAKLHSVYLSGLSQGTTYHFRARSVEESGNILTSDDYTFTTYRMPEITKYELGEVKDNSIEIKWTSNIPINSSIRYTNKETNETKIQGKPEYITDHAITIDGLDAGKSYSVEIQGADSNNNKASLPPFDVQTGLDIIPPELSQVRSQAAILSGSEDRVQAIISWRTNELSTTKLLWDLGSTKGDKFTNVTREDTNLTTNHISVITQFKPGTVYRFRVVSADKFGNTSVSQDYSILTPVKRQSVIQMIMGKFEDIFGWMNKIRK